MIEITETNDYRLIAQLNVEVQNLHAQLHPALFKPHNIVEIEKALAAFLSDPNCKTYLAHFNGIPIGYALFFIREINENAFHYQLKSLYIDQIAVLSKYQQTGAGKLLLEQAELLAKANGIQRIELDHWSSNTVAAAYFRKRGFTLCKERLLKELKP